MVMQTPGVGSICWISVITELVWSTTALFWWCFNSVDVRWGLGMVAIVCNAVEASGARAADVGADQGRPDLNGCRQLGRFTAVTFARLSQWACSQAAFRVILSFPSPDNSLIPWQWPCRYLC